MIACLACGTLAAKSQDAYAYTTKYVNERGSEGDYKYDYETSNGISALESGVGGVFTAGAYAYYTPEGELIQLTYAADENGFQPRGEHLPTPPPIPRAILKSLEYIRTHPNVEYRN